MASPKLFRSMVDYRSSRANLDEINNEIVAPTYRAYISWWPYVDVRIRVRVKFRGRARIRDMVRVTVMIRVR